MPDRAAVRVRGAALALLVVTPFLLGAAAGEEEPLSEEVFAFTDPDIVESSGLVALEDGLVATVNDSGDSGRVFTVDAATGATVGTTSWPATPTDVEALAPAGPGQVWVADIGDNRGVREEVSVLRVPVGRGDRSVAPEPVVLRYPDGPRDAEALLAHPLTGRLTIITKGVFAGEAFLAPARLRPGATHELVPVGRTGGIVTDAVHLPLGGAVVTRTYGRAVVHAADSWEVVAGWDLPDQQQGEGLAVRGDRLLLSSEGAGSTVLAVDLPGAALVADLARSPLGTAYAALATLGGPLAATTAAGLVAA